MMTCASIGLRRPGAAAGLLLLAALPGCGDRVTNEPDINPVPTVASLSRTESLAGSAGFVLTVTGSGFVSSSRVLVATRPRPALSTSRSSIRVQIEAADLAVATTLAVAVHNPAPGGGVSNAIEFRVLNPVPAVASLSRSEGVVGSPGLALTVNGSDFVATSVVLFGDQVRTPVSYSPTALDVQLLDTDLAATGTVPVAVRNPAPGGGTSNALEFRLVNPPPQLVSLPAAGATAGGPGFTLTVYGQGFVGGSVVRWNGQPRTTQRVSASRLRASISASDVAAPGVASITVENPAPGGGTSAALPLTIRAVGSAVTTSVIRMPLVARDLVADTARGVLYVSVPTSDPVNGNRVLRIDPATGQVTGSIFVGSEPGRLAMSRDGARLYVGLDGASAVRRIGLASFQPDIQWALPPGEFAYDIEGIPGSPGTVAVARRDQYISRGVTIYDNGNARPVSTEYSGASVIVALDAPDLLYGLSVLFGTFHQIAITSSGAVNVRTTSGLFGSFTSGIVGVTGRIYGTDGSIVDAEFAERVGAIASGYAIRPDPVTGRVFVLGGAGIEVYDMNTFIRLATIPLSGYTLEQSSITIQAFVRWGEDGLAFLDIDELFLVRSPIVAR